MDTDTDFTSDTQTGTQDTIGSSELNADEAAAITRSMDMSLAFWGHSQDPPEKIPATRLKCGLQRHGKASSVALKIWEKMTQRDLDKVKEIEVTLMKEGEIGTWDLFHSLKSIIEGIGFNFEEIIKSVDKDPLESTISLANEILHIFNQNEPPEIVEEEDYGSFIHYHPVSSISKRSEKQRKELSSKMKYLLNKAQKLGLRDIKVPSSPYLTERSKLSLIEKQVKAKMKLRNVQQALQRQDRIPDYHEPFISKYGQAGRYSKKRLSTQQKRENKRSSLADRPKFRTAVKAESLRYEDLIKHAPDLSKRMKRVHEIRKKLLEKSNKNTENKNSNNMYGIQNTKSHHFASPFNFNNYNQSFKGKSPKPRKRFHLSSRSNCCIGPYDSDESISNTKINITIESNDVIKKDGCFQNTKPRLPRRKRERPPSREEMLLEMKKMLKEAVQEVAMSNTIIRPSQILEHKRESKSIELSNETIRQEYEHKGIIQTLSTGSKSIDEDNAETPIQKRNKDDTVVTVTQESGLTPFRQIINTKDENKVSTEVKVSKSLGGQGLKVSVISKLSGSEAETEEIPRPRTKQRNVQEAINVLKEYLALSNNDNIVHADNEESQQEEDQNLMLNSLTGPFETDQEQSITSQTVTTTEIIIEPNEQENKEVVGGGEEPKLNADFTIENEMGDDSDVPTVQAYAVTMFMPYGGPDELRPYSPFQIGGVVLNRKFTRWMTDEVGDVGDNGWSSWNSPVWNHSEIDDAYISSFRNESDSLYVNTSEEQIFQAIGADESSTFQTQMTSSTTSIIVTRNLEGPKSNTLNIMRKAVFGIYKFLLSSLVGVLEALFNNSFSIRRSLSSTEISDDNDNQSSSE